MTEMVLVHTVDDTTGRTLATSHVPLNSIASGGTSWGGIAGTLSNQTDLQTALDGKQASGSYADAAHNHDAAYAALAHDHNAAYDAIGSAASAQSSAEATAAAALGAHVAAADPHTGYQRETEKGSANGYASLDAGGKVPAAQLPAGQGAPAWGDITGTLSSQTDLQTALDGKQAAGSYEPANANIQAHVVSAHAPANAQANADITKAEIEAKLTGVIASHSHAGGGGGGQTITFVADGAVLTLTNQATALNFLAASHRFATKADLTNFTQVRFIVNKQATAGAAASKIILRYITAFSATASSWLDIGTSEVSVAINVQNTVLATAWINLATGAKADVFICPLMSGGDAVLDPTIGHMEAQFK